MYNLYSPQGINRLAKDFNFKWRKKWGQNFLVDKNYIDKIIEAANLSLQDHVVEIGPGLGVLTKALAQKVGKVTAIEIDEKLLPILANTLSGLNNVEVINADILDIKLNELIDKPFKVAANLPYYITTPIIMKMLEQKLDIPLMVFMVQKEVAERMAASPGGKEYGALSVAVQYYSIPEVLVTIPPGAFYPSPQVSSAVVRLVKRTTPVSPVNDEAFLFRTVKAAFGQRRKTLSNALSVLKIERERLNLALEECDINPKRRGETLAVEDFIRLSNKLYDIIYLKN